MASSDNNDVLLLKWKVEIQQEIIDKLISVKSSMEVDYKVQSDLMEIELTSMREKCERSRRRIEELKDVSKPNNFQPTLDGSLEENEPVKGQDEKPSDEINDLECRLARDCEHCPAATFGRENENYEMKSESNDTGNVERKNTNCCEKLVDSNMGISDGLDEESAVADTVNSIVQRVVEADEVQAKPKNKYMYRKQDKENRLDLQLTLNPICALQELCHSRGWPMPKYEFFQEDNTRQLFTTECSALTFTIRVEGMKKKDGKKQAATLMYLKTKNFTDGDVRLEHDSETNVPENKSEGNEMLGDARVSTSDKYSEKPNIPDEVDAPAPNSETLGAVKEISEFEMSKDVVTTELRNEPSENLHESVVNGGDGSLSGDCDRNDRSVSGVADIAKILRLSKNPSARALKEMKAIGPATVLSNTELLHRIVEEEGLTLEYDLYNDSALPIGEKYFNAVQITIIPCALTVIGYGETAYDGREDVALECLTRFKSMLEEQDV